MRAVECECGETFTSGRDAVDHGKRTLHKVTGLFFSHRLELEEHFHRCGICTHVSQVLGGGARTICIARSVPVIEAKA